MSKKKKHIKEAKRSIKVLRSGKLHIRDEKISLKPFIQESLENTKVSRLNALISVESAKLKENVTNVIHHCQDSVLSAYAFSKANPVKPTTLVITVQKNKAKDMFDFAEDSIIGKLLRISTLGILYENVRDKWIHFNEDKGNFTNILYIPKILVFSDPYEGGFLNSLTYINLLIVAVPKSKDKLAIAASYIDDDKKKKNEDNITKVSKIDKIDSYKRIIADIADAAIKCGCDRLVIDPYQIKEFYKNPVDTAKAWKEIITSKKFSDHVEDVIFSLYNDSDFITFTANY